jgi:hypothetical protein
MVNFNDYTFEIVHIRDIKGKPDFRKRRYFDAIYYGETKEGDEREGLGIMLYFNKRMYEGSWLGDLRQGQGREIFSNGNTYKGEY